jgi:peptidyl-prolyl cis-trans isomerase C
MNPRNMQARFRLVLLAGAISGFAASAAPAAGVPDVQRPLVLVGGDTLTIADLDAEISAALAAGQGPRQVPEIDPAAALKRLTQNRLLEQEGYRIGAHEAKTVQIQVRELVRSGSVKALMDSVSAPPAGTDPGQPDSLLGRTNTMRRYSHILVPDEALARTLRDSLSAGVPFADLARRHSTDANAALGGDLGWAAENAYVDEFEAAARKLERNQVAGPVRTKFGWHLVTLTDTRTDTLRSETMAKAYRESRERQRRTDAVRKYVASLRTKYGVVVNDTLLASLDYGSKDPGVLKRLESNDAVLTLLPTGRLTVAGLTRKIRFQYFHGLADHPDAAAIRNGMFDEWLSEALLTHEAHALGMDRAPVLLRAATREERRLVREEVLTGVLKLEFKPTDAEVHAYYGEHRKELTPAPRVKVQSVLITEEEAARRFRRQLDGGAAFKWLVERTPEVKEGSPPIPQDWIEPEKLGMKDAALTERVALGPLSVANGWVVAEIEAVEKVEVPPLDKCRDKVLRMMRGERNRRAIDDAIATLEAGTSITIVDGARDAVADRIGQWRAAVAAGGQP